MENEGSTSPTWNAIRRLSVATDSRSPSTLHPQVSGLQIPPLRTSSTRPQRFPGDGMDYRRPINSTRDSSSQTPFAVIDLTGDDAGPSTASARPLARGPGTTRAQRPPRFSREIIDIDQDSHPNSGPSEPAPDPEVQFISSRPINPPRQPSLQRADRFDDDIESLFADDIATIRIHELDVARNRARNLHPTRNVAHPWAENLNARDRNLVRELERQFLQTRRPREPMPPPRGQRRNRPATARISVGFHVPVELNFERIGFDLMGAGPPPPPPTYDAPATAPDGFTRSPAEDDVLVCPNCGDELCVGESDLKRQVWILRGCGHVYCGDCANNRFSTKKRGKEKLDSHRPKPFKVCVVDGCDKKTSSRTAMIQVFL